jgi:hypothetical protein
MYEGFIKDLEAHPDIVGVLLAGSWAKNMQSLDSDLDVYIIFNDIKTDLELFKEGLFQKYRDLHLDLSNNALQTLDEFKDFAKIGTEYGWTRYNLVRAQLEFDKTNGILAQHLEAKKTLIQEEVDTLLMWHFGDMLTLMYRTLKGTREKNEGVGLDAAELSGHLLWVYFALYGRIRPHNKYLLWELTHFPIESAPWKSEELFQKILRISSGSVDDVRDMYREIEKVARSKSYGHYIDAWGNKLDTVL